MLKHLGVSIAGALIFLLAMSAIVKADTGAHRHDGVTGEFYARWKMPNGGKPRTQSCCNKQDCYPTQFKLEGGTWFAQRREDGLWMTVPVSKLEHEQRDPEESPDGLGHVCARAPDAEAPDYYAVFCAVLGVQS